ncbi:MAG: hypothetical protein KatS3mg115_0511 [Candidatus Poribacteria bacterium]|nr:MAG: hypothetical protein KatS3mg115_0511 [Candidatus Poribacteria bacterium]
MEFDPASSRPEQLSESESKPRADLQQVLEWIAYDMRAELERVDLRGLDLRGAELWGAGLWDLDLRDCNFEGANLFGADLQRADLRGCSFLRANLHRANFYRARYDSTTRFPEGFNPDRFAMIRVEASETGEEEPSGEKSHKRP